MRPNNSGSGNEEVDAAKLDDQLESYMGEDRVNNPTPAINFLAKDTRPF